LKSVWWKPIVCVILILSKCVEICCFNRTFRYTFKQRFMGK
jgi:hypothetical protein